MGWLAGPRKDALGATLRSLPDLQLSLTLELPGRAPIRLGTHPDAARVIIHSSHALDALTKRDQLSLAEAYMRGEVDVAGDWLEVLAVTELLDPGLPRLASARLALARLLRPRRELHRRATRFHYDRAPEFFLPWLDRWRSYTHGFYESPGDDAAAAQSRKLQYAIDALALEPGMSCFDMGCGWGSFIEFAGRQGIHVHGITLSEVQHEFVRDLIQTHDLPCTVECVDLLDYQPRTTFDGAVFMGSLEHFSDYAFAARFLARHLECDARVYMDFCTAQGWQQVGAFLEKYIWTGAASLVDAQALLQALHRAGFDVRVLEDDTRSYALTCASWADALENQRKALAERWGEPTVRAFLLYLRTAEYSFRHGTIQASHLVAGREPRTRD